MHESRTPAASLSLRCDVGHACRPSPYERLGSGSSLHLLNRSRTCLRTPLLNDPEVAKLTPDDPVGEPQWTLSRHARCIHRGAGRSAIQTANARSSTNATPTASHGFIAGPSFRSVPPQVGICCPPGIPVKPRFREPRSLTLHAPPPSERVNAQQNRDCGYRTSSR